MSENRCCCNCRHDISKPKKNGFVECRCEIDGHYIDYIQTFEGWCKHWARERKWEENDD